MITNRFSPDYPLSCVQSRNGELIVVQGNGVRPARSDSAGPAVDAGMDAPTVAPTVAVNSPAHYYIARADVYKSGACYFAPPAVTFTSEKGLDPASGKAASAKTFLNQSSLSEVRVDSGGRHYLDQPSVELSATHGSGAVIEAALDETGTSGAGGDPYTGITEWKIVQAPSYLNSAGIDDGKTWYYASNGEVTLPASSGESPPNADGYRIGVPFGNLWDGTINCVARDFKSGFSYTVSGGSGSGATLTVAFTGAAFACTVGGTAGNYTVVRGARSLISVKATNYGSGYKDSETVVLRISSGSGDSDRDIILHGVTSGNPQNTAAPSHSVKSLTIKSGGSGYLVAPLIKITSNSGFGAYATCKVKNGKITEVTLENSGGGYKTPPKVEIMSGGAEVFAVSRPHLRGTYQCYYRYIDDTPEEKGGPIPSNLSPVLEVDAGEGAQSISWAVPQPTGRATKLELWRTTSNQATTLYRVASLAVTGGPTEPLPPVPGNPTEPPSGPVPPPPTPTSPITITAQPTWKWKTEYIGRWAAGAAVQATGPGVLSFQWQGRNLSSNQGTTWNQTAWTNISAGTTYLISSSATNSSIVTVSQGAGYPTSNVHYQQYRCVVSSSQAGITSVTTAISGPLNWQLPAATPPTL